MYEVNAKTTAVEPYTTSHYEEFRKGYEMGYSHGYVAGVRGEAPDMRTLAEKAEKGEE